MSDIPISESESNKNKPSENEPTGKEHKSGADSSHAETTLFSQPTKLVQSGLLAAYSIPLAQTQGSATKTEDQTWQASFHAPEKIEAREKFEERQQKLYEEAQDEARQRSPISQALGERFDSFDEDKSGTLDVKELAIASLRTPPVRADLTPGSKEADRQLMDALVLQQINDHKEDMATLRSLNNDTVRENDPVGVSKKDLEIYDELDGVKEGLTFLVDHFNRMDTLTPDQKLSAMEIDNLAEHPNLNHDTKVSIIKASQYLVRNFPIAKLYAENGLTKQQFEDTLAKLPTLPDRLRYHPDK